MSESSLTLRRRWVLLFLLVLLVGGITAWWYSVTRPDYRLARGREAIQRRDWDTVNLIAQRLEPGSPDHSALLRGESMLAQQQPAQALAILNQITSEGSIRIEAAVLSGRCLLELKNLREALRVFTWVLTQNPDQIDAHRGLAAIAHDLGNYNTAAEHLEKVATLDPTDGRPYRLMGLMYNDMRQDPQAEDTYNKALQRDLSRPFRQAVLVELAEVRIRRTKYQEALDALDQRHKEGAEENQTSSAARAESLLGLGNSKEATKVLDEALGKYPEDARLLRLRGTQYLSDRQIEQAIRTLEHARKQAPGEYLVRFQLARAYAAGNRQSDAEAEQKKAEELKKVLSSLTDLSAEAMKKPWDSAIRLKLAELCEKINRPKLAAMWYHAAQTCRAEGQHEEKKQ